MKVATLSDKFCNNNSVPGFELTNLSPYDHQSTQLTTTGTRAPGPFKIAHRYLVVPFSKTLKETLNQFN